MLKEERADWDSAKRMLADASFMRSLIDFDKDHISEECMRRLRKYLDNPDFTPESVGKQSKAAMSLCMWVQSIASYDKVAKIVEPKREKLSQTEAALNRANAKLREKQDAAAVRHVCFLCCLPLFLKGPVLHFWASCLLLRRTM